MKCPTKYLLLFWMIWGKETFMCSGHPRGFNDIHYNHTADALQRLMRVFGIEKNVPQPRLHPLPPQYMLDLYRSFTEDSSSRESFHHHHGANTVRSFYDKGSSVGSGHYHFELSNGISDDEEIVDAQFHFFTNLNIPRSHQSSHVIQIRLYDGFFKSNSRLLEARLASADASGWEVFKITSCVKKWILNAEFNKGLTVEVLDASGREWTDGSVRIVSYRRPILIVFSHDSKRAAAHRTVTKQRGIEKSSFQPIAANQIAISNQNAQGSVRSTRSASVPSNGDCTRHQLRVDFEKLGWSTWIISPKWYDAYVCAGACAFPLGLNQRPTNHATVQSIVHELGLAVGVGAPCCVPTDLHSVSLLYFDEHMNVVLKQYEDMVAVGCGCQ